MIETDFCEKRLCPHASAKIVVFLLCLFSPLYICAQTPTLNPYQETAVHHDLPELLIPHAIPSPAAALQLSSTTGLDPTSLSFGEKVVGKLKTRMDINPLTPTPARYKYEMSLSQRGSVSATSEYRELQVVRTWKEDIYLSDAQKQERLRRYGIRPLKPLEVEVATTALGHYETIYNLYELAFMRNISSDYFAIQDRVYFPEAIRGKASSYKEGVVVAIHSNGEIIVKHGIHFFGMHAKDLFNVSRNYEEFGVQFKAREPAIFRFERPASNIVTNEAAQVLATNVMGEVLVLVKKSNQIYRIPVTEQMPEEDGTPAKLQKLSSPMCIQYFKY